MIGDPVLLEVVRANLLRPAPASHLAAALLRRLRLLALLLGAQQAGPQHLQRLLLVLSLALLVLHSDDDAGREVGDPDRRVGGVDRLAARSGRPVHVDAQVVVVERDVDIVRLRQHGDRRRRRVDATLRLGDRNALHAVGPALVLHPAPDAVALEQERHLVEAAPLGGIGAEHLVLPPHPVGVPDVHVEEVLGEQVRLLASLGAADLDDHVLVVVRVAREEQHLQVLLDAGGGRLRLLRLVAHPELLGHRQVVQRAPVGPVRLHDRLELLPATAELAERTLVGQHGRIVHPVRDLGELLLQAGQSVEHRRSGYRRRR